MPDLAFTPLAARAIFLVTCFGLTVGGLPGLRVDRTGVAIIGAAAMVVTEVVSWDQAVARPCSPRSPPPSRASCRTCPRSCGSAR